MPEQPSEELIAEATVHAGRGETIVWVGRDEVLLGFLALRDEVDPSARRAVEVLRDAGLGPVLLSGDSEETTRAVAAVLGIEHFRSRMTPEEKAAYLQGLRDTGERVAMVGDGVNDAPSLALADLSVTVSGGADIAGHTSDIVLERADLELVPWFLVAAARTRRTIRQNLGWAIGYNAVALPLAAFGVITPAIAALAMASSSLLVVGNSLRLRRRLRRQGSNETKVSVVAPIGAGG